MTILADLNFYKKTFSYGDNRERTECLTILYNERNKLILNAHLISHIEKEIDNIDFFQAFIVEMNDIKQIENISTVEKKDFESTCFECYKNSTEPLTVPLSLNNFFLSNKGVTNSINLSEDSFKLYKDLLTKSITSKSCFDFDNNGQIHDFFNRIYRLAKVNKEILVFNRELRKQFISSETRCFYYSLFNKRQYLDFLTFVEEVYEFKKNLGKKSKIYYTSNSRAIHERKIIVNGINITIDNDFNNVIASEKTWTITISYCKDTEQKWREKTINFKEVRA